MPWMNSAELSPKLTRHERHEIAEGRGVVRQLDEGVVSVSPRSVISFGRIVSGPGITYGPNGEDAFLHVGARLVEET